MVSELENFMEYKNELNELFFKLDLSYMNQLNRNEHIEWSYMIK